MKLKHETCRALIKAIDAYIAKADDDIGDELKDAGYANTDETMRRTQELEEKLAEAMNVDTEIIVEQLERSDSLDEFTRNTWNVYRDASALGDDIHEVVESSLTNLMPMLVTTYLHNTDKGLVASTLRQRTTDWIASWSQQLGAIMKLTSHDGIQSILTDAMSNGKSVADVTRELMDSGIRTNYSRARATALTEMLTAHSAANQEAMMQSPAVEGKGWRHTGSRRNKPRPNHVDMDGQVVPKDEPFDLTGADGGSYKPMYPRDTNLPAKERVNCHCIHQPIVSEEVLGLPLSERKKLQQQAIDEDDKKWAVELDEQNKAKAGLTVFGIPVNALLPNANGGILKPNRVIHGRKIDMNGGEPNEVVDLVTGNGGIKRHIFNDQGVCVLRIDNNDHFRPKYHPFGNGGAHYHRSILDDNGLFVKPEEKAKCLTAKMRRLCKDIIKEYSDVIKAG